VPRDYPDHPLPAIAAMVARDGKILLVRRNKGPDKWGFPGGLLELGETVAEGALRELAEETGVVAEAGAVAEVLTIISRDETGRIRNHYVLMAVTCRWISGEPVAASDALEAGWFTRDQLRDMECHADVERLAAALL
jgi:8-oxo-dGTP diphosphatase